MDRNKNDRPKVPSAERTFGTRINTGTLYA
jgi:hypothetical protein